MSTSRGQVWAAAAYATMVLAAVALFLLIRSYGETPLAPGGSCLPASPARPPPHPRILRHLLLALTAVIVAGRCLGKPVRLLGQPPVIGEVVAGILLGPSFLGRIAPDAYLFILPPEIAPFLGVARAAWRDHLHVPGGPRAESGSASWAGPHHRRDLACQHRCCPSFLARRWPCTCIRRVAPPACRSRTSRCSSGIAMSITAFPVLARILSDQGMSDEQARRARADLRGRRRRDRLVPAGVRRGCGQRHRRDVPCWLRPDAGVHCGDVPGRASAVSAACGVARRQRGRRGVRSRSRSLPCWYRRSSTEVIGIHAIFGAFLLGAVIPHDSALARSLRQSGELVIVLLLPAFFAFTRDADRNRSRVGPPGLADRAR